MATISKPQPGEYAAHFGDYISLVEAMDLIEALDKGKKGLIAFLSAIPADKFDYRYAEGKWSVREIIIHILDVERIFAYRVLRFSRNDRTPLAGFDDDDYIAESNASERSIQSIIAEFSAQRDSTIELFRNISPEMSLRSGIANGKEISVRALGYTIPGHEIQHMKVIKERYL
jgi:hypothetical protein